MQTVAALDLRVTGGRESMNYRALAGATPPGKDRRDDYTAAVWGIGRRHALRSCSRWNSRTGRRSAMTAREYRNTRIVTARELGSIEPMTSMLLTLAPARRAGAPAAQTAPLGPVRPGVDEYSSARRTC